VQAEYQSKVQLLLAATSFPGLTSEELSTFKLANSSSVYSCRFPGCTSIVAGFATPEARAEHEKIHAPPLVCTHSGCKYRLAFSSVNSLNRHLKTSHDSDLRTVPRSIRRNKNDESSVPRIHTQPQDLSQLPVRRERLLQHLDFSNVPWSALASPNCKFVSLLLLCFLSSILC
jgi:hypothetical protein